MKFLHVASFLFCIQIAIAITNGFMVFDTEWAYHGAWVDSVNKEDLQSQEYVQGEVSADTTSFGFGDFIKGFWYFIEAVGLTIIALPWTMAQFGVPTWINLLVSIPVYFCYFLAIAQFISNRAAKSMS